MDNKKLKSSNEKIKFIDLFAGIGGFHYAFHKLDAECVFVSEWDSFARETYKHNFIKIQPTIFDQGDKNFIKDIHLVTDLPKQQMDEVIPDFDILTGGFPCQPFSQAGKKLGFQDTRGTLFHEIKKILEVKKPIAYFLENVRNLEKHDNQKTITTIENDLRKLGYSFFKKVVRGSDFGLPTHRPRLYMVGFKGDPENKIEFKFPEPTKGKGLTLSELFNGVCSFDKTGTKIRDIGYTLRVGGKGSRIEDRRNWEHYWVDGKVHKITIAEAIKMMGFPEEFEFKDIPETQKWKQLGNSVAVNSIQATANAVISHIKEHNLYEKSK